MPVWLILPVAIGTALFSRLFARRYRIVRRCSEEHRVGLVTLTHHAKIPCDVALWAASHAQEIWEKLGDGFPKETLEPFELDVIWDRNRHMGFKLNHTSRAVINMAYFFIDVSHPDSQEQELRGTIAEELHHIVRYRERGEEEPYQFRPDPEESNHFELVLYYSINEFEYAALRFCAQATGNRSDLLGEVEEYREATGREI